MGQAKERGSRDQRAAEAMGLQQRSVSEIREEYGLPESAALLGYAVHLETQDEFLAEYSNTPLAVRKAWAKTPEMALRFQSIAEAIDVSRHCAGAIVVVMFDVGEQIVVFAITGLRSVTIEHMGI